MRLSQNLIKAGILGAGACIGPIAQLLATPFLTRIYTPADFGYLALFTSIVSVLIVVSCLRYEGVIQVVSENDLGKIISLALLSALGVLVVEHFLLSTGIPQIQFESLHNLGSDVKFLPFASAAGAALLIITNFTLRQGRYVRNAFSRSGTTIVFIAIALGCPAFGLIYANIAASILMGIIALIYLLLNTKFGPINKVLALGKKYIEYPLFLTPTSLLDTVTLALPILFMSGSYGMEAVGQFTQIQKLLGAPIILLGIIAAQLFSKRSGELFRSGLSSKKLLWNTVGLLALASLFTLLIASLFGETLSQFILGEEWKASTFFIILAIAPCLVRSVVSPVSFIFLVYQKIKYLVLWQVLYFIVSYSVLHYAASTMNLERFIISYIITESFMYMLYLSMANYVSKIQNTSPPMQ